MESFTRRGISSHRFRMTVMVWVFIAGLAGATAGLGASQPISERNGLSQLRHGTGWILLGDLDLASGKWATALKYRIAKRATEERSIVPGPEDVLLITTEFPIVIFGYRDFGEEYRLMSPAGRATENSDLTGISLAPGSQVVVEEVSRGAGTYGLQGVWARVVAR